MSFNTGIFGISVYRTSLDLTLDNNDDANDKVYVQEQNQPNATHHLFKMEPEFSKQIPESQSSSNGSTNSDCGANGCCFLKQTLKDVERFCTKKANP